MRISYEPLLLVVLTLVLSCASLARGAFSWHDCGSPLGRQIYYHSVDIYPETIVAGQDFAFNFAIEIDKFHIWEGNYLEIKYNGNIVYNVSTTSGCNVTSTFQCPYYPTSLSLTDVYHTPLVPAGSYTARITNVFGTDSFESVIGCVEITVDVINSSPLATGCKYTSNSTIALNGFPVYLQDATNPSIGDWIRVGPSSSFDPSSPDSSENWATFASIYSSKDLLFSGAVSDPSDYIWGFNATLLNLDENQLTYKGTFFVGYVGDSFPQFTDPVSNPLLNGALLLIIEYTSEPFTIKSATANITIPYPLGFQPNGWPYILGYGRISPLTLNYNGNSNPIITGNATIDTCTTITPAKTNASSLVNIPSSEASSSNLSEAQKWSIGLGVASFFLLVVIFVLFYIAWRQGKRPLRHKDEDLVDPLKPDYGSQAINDIIDGSEDLPRV